MDHDHNLEPDGDLCTDHDFKEDDDRCVDDETRSDQVSCFLSVPLSCCYFERLVADCFYFGSGGSKISQDGGANLWGEALTYDLESFLPKNCMKMNKWTERGRAQIQNLQKDVRAGSRVSRLVGFIVLL